jgi:hypothetical protein
MTLSTQSAARCQRRLKYNHWAAQGALGYLSLDQRNGFWRLNAPGTKLGNLNIPSRICSFLSPLQV